jgi:hypothetical protein
VSDTGKVAVGVIVGYGRPFFPFLKKSKVLVRLDYRVIPVLVDQDQYRLIREGHSVGDRIAVGFYGGEWHIGISKSRQAITPPLPDTDDRDLLSREMEGIDLLSLIWRPEIEEARPPSEPESAALPVTEQDVFWEDLDKYRDYLKKVELEMQENYGTILERLGLSYLDALANKKKSEPYIEIMPKESEPPDDRLDLIIAQNREIAANQKEILRLLKKIPAFNKKERPPKGKIN